MKFLKGITQEQDFKGTPIAAFTFNLLFNRKTWIIMFVLAAFTSFYVNYRLLKAQYVIACGVNGQTVARFITKSTCNDLLVATFDAQELYRIQTVQAMDLND